MTDATLNPPARFSHGLLLTIVVVIAIGLSGAIGQRPTVFVAIGTLALFLVGFWAFSQETVLLTAAATLAVQVGGVGVLVTAAWAFIGAFSAPSLSGFLLNIGVTLALVSGVVAVVGEIVPTPVTNQDGPAIVALLYGGGLATTLVSTVVALQLGAASLFGRTTPVLVGETVTLLFDLATANPVARAGSLTLLAGAVLWYVHRLVQLPLARRLIRALTHRSSIATQEQWGQRSDATDDRVHGEPGVSRGGKSFRWAIGGAVGLGQRAATASRWVGAGAFYLGLTILVVSLAPDVQPIVRTHPIARMLGSVLGPDATPQQFLGTVLAALFGLRVTHELVWHGLNIDWAASGRRLGYVAGTILALGGAGLAGRPVIEGLLAVPPLQVVPMRESAPVVVATESGVQFVNFGLQGLQLQPQPAIFEPWFDGFIQIFGPALIGVAAFAVAIWLGTLLLVIGTIGAGGARLTRPGMGIGILFVAAAGGAALGAPQWVAFAAGAGALLAAELYTHGGSLTNQLDSEASTLTAELVHLGASVVLIGGAVFLTLLATRAVQFVPTTAAQWQVFSALTLSLSALALGVLYLGLRGDQADPSGEAT